MREKFLQQVADYYLRAGSDLAHTTFVFPNRRSALFMRKYMQDAMDADCSASPVPRFMPRMVSITHFIQQFDGSKLATPTELAFLLYKVYARMFEDETDVPDFDRFYFWANIILKDFNDVDAYMADADKLYRNLRNIKEMRANYFTPEQIEVIRYLFGEDFHMPDADEFWADMELAQDPDSPSAKFLRLWQVMGPLYREFIKELDSQSTPLAYSGLQSRRAAKAISDMGVDDFKGRRFVFVGFNVLTSSRILIFQRLQNLGIADFFWDIASPIIAEDKGVANSPGRFIMPLAKKFKMPEDFELQPIEGHPEIEIIAVPSNTGQAKVVSSILERWAQQWQDASPDHQINQSQLVDTAVVMADDSLLTQLLYAVPPQIDSINVTMGISYSSTPFAALMSAIISMHLRARSRKGAFYYYYQDVIDVLSHPHISLIARAEAEALKSKILINHIYNISAEEILSEFPRLGFIFRQIDDDKDLGQIRDYIMILIETLTQYLSETLTDKDEHNYYELSILQGYTLAVDELMSLLQRYGIRLHERTFLQMIERALTLSAVNFAGEPLKGLQLMSVRDTRTLDFKNLIMTSMNERIFPQRNYTPSFIPMNLRRGYGLPTQEFEESAVAYQFYRLISRAQRVCLLYDSRTDGVISGERSRFLSQLLHLHKDYNVRQRTVEFCAELDEVPPVIINKTPDVIAELRRFRPGGDFKLSASALKDYISCPLKFYLRFVKQMRADDETLDYIDASSYGTVIHQVAQDLYEAHKDQVINDEVLDIMKNDELEHRALSALNHLYYKDRYTADLTRIPGEGQIIAKVIAQYIRRMLDAEKSLQPFVFVGAEVGQKDMYEWQINDKYTLNFKFSIDRIDRFRDPENPGEVALRFIDYKTGGDKLSAPNIDALFENPDASGIFQLLLYCHAYASDSIAGYKGRIKPLIYKFQTIPSDGIANLKLEKSDIEDYRAIEGFYEKFEELIDKIFEEDNLYPFCQTEDLKHCLFCPFVQLCGRFPEKNEF